MTVATSSPSEQQLSEVLSEFARTMVTDFPIQAILDRLVQSVVEVLPISAAGVTLTSPDARTRYVAASNAVALRYEKLQSDDPEGLSLVRYETDDAMVIADHHEEDGTIVDGIGERAIYSAPYLFVLAPPHIFYVEARNPDGDAGLEAVSQIARLILPRLIEQP